jgi:hypothetical protein
MEAPRLRCENRSRYVAHAVSLVVALLMCLGLLLLPLRAAGSEVPSDLAMGSLLPLDLETNGNAPPLEETYVVALGEAEDAEKTPLNAELLTMLFLTLCFGLSVRWLLRNTQRQGALCSLAVVGRSFTTACEELPYLGIFRL